MFNSADVGGHRCVVHRLQLLFSILGRVGSAHTSFEVARPPALRAAFPRKASVSVLRWPAAEVRPVVVNNAYTGPIRI